MHSLSADHQDTDAADGLGLFLPGNPGFTRHAATIRRGRAALLNTSSAHVGGTKHGFLDGDERIAALAADDQATSRELAGGGEAAILPPWTIKPSDGKGKERRAAMAKANGGVSLWSRRHVRVVLVVLLLTAVCGSHAFRLWQRLQSTAVAPQTANPTTPF